MFPIILPKTVEIRNPRLVGLYYFLLIGAFAFIVIRFVANNIWLNTLPVDSFKVSLWVNGVTSTNYDQLAAEFSQKLQSPHCSEPEQYDYWFDQNWRYTNHTCLPLCEEGSASIDCAAFKDLYVIESPDQVVVLTQIQDMYMIPGRTNSGQNFHFLPAPEALGIGVQYSYDLSGQMGAVTADPWFQRAHLKGSTTVDILTVLLDSEGGHNRTIMPGSSISLSVPELLALAGRPNLLDEPQETLGANMLEGTANSAYAAGPAARLAGVDLVLNIDCKNFHEVEIQSPWTGVICYTSLAIEQAWTNLERADLIGLQGELRHRQYHGLRVRVKGTGSMSYYDINAIYLYLVAGIVVLKLPSAVMNFFAKNCLGHLSQIYSRMLSDKLTIPDLVAIVASRVMANSVVFTGMEDVKDQGVSRRAMAARLQEGLKFRKQELNDQEMKRFVDYCFWSICSEGKKAEEESKTRRRGVWHEARTAVSRWFGTAKIDAVSSEASMNIDTFNVAQSSMDPMNLVDLVKLFDQQRPRSWMERLFTPRQISHALFAEEAMFLVNSEKEKLSAMESGGAPEAEPGWNRGRTPVDEPNVLVMAATDCYDERQPGHVGAEQAWQRPSPSLAFGDLRQSAAGQSPGRQPQRGFLDV